jgi:hypothetical protein
VSAQIEAILRDSMTPILPTAAAIVALHDSLLADVAWPASSVTLPPEAVWSWVVTNHRNNGMLWAEEDLARRTQVSDHEIATNKRHIDAFNQARNDATERVDELLLLALGLVTPESARTDTPLVTAARLSPQVRLNSETAGSMIDRMSILSLKIHAMRAQTQRQDVDESHRRDSHVKLERLMQQRMDLGQCFDELLMACQTGLAYFKVYRQFKMYNDPKFNPALVAEQQLLSKP